MKIAHAVAALGAARRLLSARTVSGQPAGGRARRGHAGPRVAICYNTLISSLAEVQQAAQQECAPETVATYSSTDWYLQFCPLLLPARATFVCAPKGK